MTKYTPAPWNRNIKPASKYNTIFSGRNTHVAHLATNGLTEEEIEANCNLIVAAPELLDTLKKLKEGFAYAKESGNYKYVIEDYAHMINEAINKAEPTQIV